MVSKEELLEKAAGELAGELATMHGTLFGLINALRDTRLSKTQTILLNRALIELHRSQAALLEKSADMAAGTAPEGKRGCYGN